MKNSLSLIILLLLFSCTSDKTQETIDVVTNPQPIELLNPNKGFKKIYGYVGELSNPEFFQEITAQDMTMQANNTINFCFGERSTIGINSSFKAFRGSINSQNFSVVDETHYQGGSFYPHLNTLKYITFTNKLASFDDRTTLGDFSGESMEGFFGYPDYHMTKFPHMVGNPQDVGGQGYGYTCAYSVGWAKTKVIGNNNTLGLRGGFFEPIENTNEGIVALYFNNRIEVNSQTLDQHFSGEGQTLLGTVTHTATPMDGKKLMPLEKLNANNNDMTFGYIHETDAGLLKVWTFKFNYTSKQTVCVLDGVVVTNPNENIPYINPALAKVNLLPENSYDIDNDGNFYYLGANFNSVYKISSTATTLVGQDNILKKGDIGILRYFNGKIYLMALHWYNGIPGQYQSAPTQMDILVQE